MRRWVAHGWPECLASLWDIESHGIAAINDEELIRRFEAIEKKVDATASLVRIGVPALTGLNSKVNAPIDSQVQLYDSIQQISEKLQVLADAQVTTEQNVQALAAAQAITEQKLQVLIDTLKQSRNGGSAPEVSD